MKGLKDLSHEERLSELGLFRPEKTKLRENVVSEGRE